MQIGNTIRRMTGRHWLVLFGLVLVSWLGVFVMGARAQNGASFWGALRNVTASGIGFWSVFAMWGLMAGAMMAPTFLPSLATFEDLTHTMAAPILRFWEHLAGYLVVWLGFSALAAGVQVGVARAGVSPPSAGSTFQWLTSGLLAVAGLYQFSTLKGACLSKCRQPMTFYMQFWRETRWNSAQMGVRLGLYCLGCCWALMLLGFVGGVANLAWMGGATLLMVIEKLPAMGRHITRPVGWVLLAGAAFEAGRALIS